MYKMYKIYKIYKYKYMKLYLYIETKLGTNNHNFDRRGPYFLYISSSNLCKNFLNSSSFIPLFII